MDRVVGDLLDAVTIFFVVGVSIGFPRFGLGMPQGRRDST
jgi:hypothetical protein